MNENYDDKVLTANDISVENSKMSAGRKVACAFELAFAILSTLAFLFAAYCAYEIIAIRVSGEVGLGEGISVAIFVMFGVLAAIVVCVCALVGLIFFLFSRKAKNRISRILSLSLFIYHVCAASLSILAYLSAIYVNNAISF